MCGNWSRREEKSFAIARTNTTEAILDQTVEQREWMNATLIALRCELLPRLPRQFALLAEGPLEEIRRLAQNPTIENSRPGPPAGLTSRHDNRH